MKLNEAGKIAEKCWQELPYHFPNIQIDAFVVMPDHVHGIIIILRNISCQSKNIAINDSIGTNLFMSIISPKTGSISAIIRSYKSACTMNINKSIPALRFGWQPRYYDNIIRDLRSLEIIRRYIRLNPKRAKLSQRMLGPCNPDGHRKI
jgi:putative transposase